MKKIIYFLAIFTILSACTSGNQENGNNEQQPADTSAAEAILEEPADIAYTQCPLAYLVGGQLYFHSFDEDKKVVFSEEKEDILNFTFNPEGNTLYYSIERDGSLWLKLADISESTITPKWLADWGLTKMEFTRKTDDGPSPLYYYKGQLVSQYNYIFDIYAFNKTAIYSIANKKVTRKEFDYDFLSKVYGELSDEKCEQYFQTVDQQLYYLNNNTKVALTNQLNLEEIKREWYEEFWNETDFAPYSFSPDKTKILFASLIWQAELTMGPYCISNIDGSKQMILEQTSTDRVFTPIWLKNNKIAFVDDENKLFVADNDKNSIRQIAENVMIYVAR